MLRVLLSLIVLASLSTCVHAQICNTPSGFVQTVGPIPLGNFVALGPGCNNLQDGGSIAPVATKTFSIPDSFCNVDRTGGIDFGACMNTILAAIKDCGSG